VLVPIEEVRKLAEGILLANGVPADHARTQAGLFLEAEMRAIPSHGFLRLRRVIERIQAGLTVPGVTGKQNWTARSFLSVDGMRGLGPVVLYALYSFCLTSYFAYLYPVLIGRIRWWMFVLAIATSVVPLTLIARFHHRRTGNRQQVVRHALIPALGMQALLLVLYVFGLIPPVPLSLMEIGIYHDVVRDELLRSGIEADVTTIAMRHGFAHLGRFSAYYRETFGEGPSATLRRGRTRPIASKRKNSGVTR